VVGEIVNEMIPKVYDAERVMMLEMPESGLEQVTLNQRVNDYLQDIQNDMTRGTYTVMLKPGPSFENQKQEALISLKEVLQANPQAFNLIADLYAENLPVSNNIELRNRLRTIVPPEIIEAGKTGKPLPPKPPQPDPQMQAKMAEMQLKERELQLKQQEFALKQEKQTIDTQIKLQEIENEKLDIAAKLEEQEMRFAAETHRTNTDEQIAHADNLAKIISSKIKQ
jgi:hypothetical protein